MHADKIRFKAAFPKAFFLDIQDMQSLEHYLKEELQVLNVSETITELEKPGEGNMNCVVRVKTTHDQFILKQARPWVEKYPHISAPIERLSVEHSFYESIQEDPYLVSKSPKIRWFVPQSYLMAMDDLGTSSDYSTIYQPNVLLAQSDLKALVRYLHGLHSLDPPHDFPDNMKMRLLNHEHIFNYPFKANNGLDLDQFTRGLSRSMPAIVSDHKLLRKIKALGEAYLSQGNQIIHGDFYPGSWLQVGETVKVIDPEFAFVGQVEFDLGVLIAHLHLADQPRSTIELVKTYADWAQLEVSRLAGFVGVEVLRRLLGVAQLPMASDLATKEQLIDKAISWIRGHSQPC